MRIRMIVWCVAACLVLVDTALAAPRYWNVAGSANTVWQTALRLDFTMDEKRCRTAYGEEWFEKCSAAVNGAASQPVSGVRVKPHLAGEWRWDSTGAAVFHPEQGLSPNTAYTLDVANMLMPAEVHLNTTSVVVHTLPRAVSIGQERVWIDPSPKAQHAVSVPLRFTWPVDSASVEKRLVVAADKTSGLVLGARRITWNQNATEALLTIPLERLGAQTGRIQITVRDMPLCWEKNGRVQVQKQSKEAQYAFAVPGSDSVFAVRDANITMNHDANLAQEWRLELSTTLRMRPRDALKSLHVVQLPRTLTPEAHQPCDWRAMPAVSAEDLNRGEVLKPVLLQSPDEPTGTLRFRLPVLPGRYVLVSLDAKAGAASGQTLARTWQGVLRAPDAQPEISFLQPGNVLAISGERTLDIHTSGLTALEWRVARVRDPFLALLARGATYEQPYMDFDTMSDAASGRIPLASGTVGEAQFVALKLDELLGSSARGLMSVELIGWKDNENVAMAQRLVLVSNMGLMVKTSGEGRHTAFVNNLASGLPEAGVDVRILGANGQPVAIARTNAEGRVDLPSVRGFAREKLPVAVVAAKGQGAEADMAWLSLFDEARRVDTSAFAVAGRHSTEDGLVASVFTQRGLYQPGETLHFGALIRRTNWKPLPEDLPLTAVLTNPAGREVLRQKITPGREGLVVLEWGSSTQSPMGRYRLDVLAGASAAGNSQQSTEGEHLGSVTVRVEAFQPDTMVLAASFTPEAATGWIRTNASTVVASDKHAEIRADVRLRNLYGAPAAERRVRGFFRSWPATLEFVGYEDFVFFDAAPFRGDANELTLPEVRTNANGEATVFLPQDRLRAGTMEGVLLLEGFEAAGGRAVTLQKKALFSPMEQVMGWRPSGEATNLEYVLQNSTAALRFVTLNNALQAVSPGELKLVVSARRFVTSLVTDARGEYRYDETPVDTPISQTTLTPDKGGFTWNIPTHVAGDFLLTVSNSAGDVLALTPFTVAGQILAEPQGLTSRSLAPGRLRLRLDKPTYEPGESMNMRLSAPYAGYGLITIERDTIVAHQWIRAAAGDSVHSVVLPEHFEGRGYVSVSFVRDMASEAIYMQPHSVAVEPFTVGMARRDMGLSLQVPQHIKPGEDAVVRLYSKTPGKAVVFAVDEGVLQLTQFQTPDPLRDLLADRALGVTTRQIYDVLMPDHARLRGRIPGFGGDLSVAGGGRFANPFKRRAEPPFTLWSGVVDVSPQGVDIPFVVPAYVNSRVRFMAVGASMSGESTDVSVATLATGGSVSTSVEVRGDVVLTPQIPLAVTPGDEFAGALVLANTSDTPSVFSLTMEADAALHTTRPLTQSIEVAGGGEQVVPFTMQVQDILGEAAVRFVADNGKGLRVERTVTLSVRPASPRLRMEQAGISTAATPRTDIVIDRVIYPFEAVHRLSVSAVPLPLLRAFVARLDAYPYGCTEQLISRAMPYAALAAYPALQAATTRNADVSPAEATKQIEALYSAALRSIDTTSNYGEGVGMWPGEPASIWLTAYAGDFILTMREAGRGIPANMYGVVFNALERQVYRSPATLEDARAIAYGLWVLSRDGRIMTQPLEQLVQVLSTMPEGWKDDLTLSFVAGSYALLRMDNKAQAALPDAPRLSGGDTVLSALGAQAFHAMVLARHFPEKLTDGAVASALADASMAALSRGGVSTASSALAVRALAALTPVTDTAPAELRCTQVASGFLQTPGIISTAGGLTVLDAPGCVRYSLVSPQPLYWHVLSDGFDRAPAPASAAGMDIERQYLDAMGHPLGAQSVVHLGDLVTVSLTVRAHGTPIRHVVLEDLLPGALEPLLPLGNTPTTSGSFTRFERHEDRGIFFLDLTPEPQTVTYTTRATASGRFIAPSAGMSAMYAPDLAARSAAGHLVVE